MASIKKRGNKWQARITYKNRSGEFTTKNQSGFRTKKEAEIYASSIEQDISRGILPDDDKVSHIFSEYFLKWFEDFKRPKLSERTQNRYIITYHELKKYFESSKIESITRREYQKFITWYGSSHAKDTVQKVNSLVRACVRNAIYEDLIIKDFTNDVELVFDASKDRHIEYLNIDETRRLVSCTIEKANKNFTSNQMILTAIFTGMRLGEIQGLKWSNVNFNFKAITVDHSFNESKQSDIPTKTKSSVRVIRVNDTLINILKILKENSSNDYVFVNQYGTVPTSASVNKQLKNILSELKIERIGFHFHSLRHTHVAYLLSRGVDIYAISKRLGHADVGTTTRIYSYLIDEYKAKTDVQIEGFLSDLVTSHKSLDISKTVN